MKKNLCSVLGFLALAFALFFVFSPLEKASANEIIQEDIEKLAKDYNLENIEFTDTNLENAFEFDTVEEFEAFLKSQEVNGTNNNIVVPVLKSPKTGLISTLSTNGTKTYTYKEFTGVSTITSYAKVTREKGKVTKVVVWSDQSGISFPISYSQNATDYDLNSTKTGGTAYVYGTKSYGVTVGGQGIAYKLSVTYEVKF